MDEPGCFGAGRLHLLDDRQPSGVAIQKLDLGEDIRRRGGQGNDRFDIHAPTVGPLPPEGFVTIKKKWKPPG